MPGEPEKKTNSPRHPVLMWKATTLACYRIHVESKYHLDNVGFWCRKAREISGLSNNVCGGLLLHQKGTNFELDLHVSFCHGFGSLLRRRIIHHQGLLNEPPLPPNYHQSPIECRRGNLLEKDPFKLHAVSRNIIGFKGLGL